MWDSTMKKIIDGVKMEFLCRVAFKPTPHVKVARSPPSTEPQAHIIIDFVQLEGKNYLHSIDECTTWSEA